MKFFRNYWKRAAKKKKGLFGGEIQSHEEIRKLDKQIQEHEEREFKQFEAGYDEELNAAYNGKKKKDK